MLKTINLLLLVSLAAVRADIPVHCVKHQIQGTWKLQLSAPVLNGKGPVPCGHDVPDRAETSYQAGQESFEAAQEFELNLNEDNSVSDKENSFGRWTMIYDEGFEISFQNSKYFAFSKYSPTTSRDFTSQCGQTLIGWFSNFNTGDRGCYRAEKVSEKVSDTGSLEQVSIVQPEYQEQKNQESAKGEVKVYISANEQANDPVQLDDPLDLDVGDSVDNSIEQEYQENVALLDDQYAILPTTQDSSTSFSDSPIAQENYEMEASSSMNLQFNDPELDMDIDAVLDASLDQPSNAEFMALLQTSSHQQIVDHLNSMPGLKWTAKMYPQFEGKSVKQLNQMAGRRRYSQHSRKSVFAQMNSKTNTNTNTNTRMPEAFSWEQYLAQSVQQESCGSCYAIATMEMLSARLRIKGEDVTLSPQYSLDCNYYNQGCDGGYPYLVEKFAQEQYLVTEEQYPYRAHNGKCKEMDFKSFATLYSVGDFEYVGGAYGMSNEEAIMEEIYNNGPVVMSFEPTQSFMYYGGGIFHSVEQERSEWEKVDHSVLCYGWGEENGEKFWLLQNSWGPQWGENGRFRMRRGVDDSAIESMAEAAAPIVIRNNVAANSLFVQTNLRKSG